MFGAEKIPLAVDPAHSDAAAKREGLSILDRVRAIRAEFGLSMTEAKEDVDTTDGKPPLFPREHLCLPGPADAVGVAPILWFLKLARPQPATIVTRFPFFPAIAGAKRNSEPV